MPRRRHNNREVGDAAEALAQNHLQRHGLELLTRNYLVRGGEIDLVMRDGPELVFVEVRSRSDALHGAPEETVDLRKQRRIILAARYYASKLTPPPRCRFDVFSVCGTGNEQTSRWIKNAFDATGATWVP